MSYDFMRTYEIPNVNNSEKSHTKSWGYGNLQQPPQPPSALLMGYCDTNSGSEYLAQESTSFQQFQQPQNRSTHVATHGPKFRPPLKRKYSTGPGAASVKPEPIAETTADGKLTIFQGRDDSYPDDLNRLIHPLLCELCKTQANSMSSAKDHYESKAHDRNLTAWLKKNFNQKGLNPPVVKRFLKTGGPSGPEAFHCELCDLNLTSLMHATQHYAGRKHRLVASQTSKPSGAGYYNAEGKWVRTASKLKTEVVNEVHSDVNETVTKLTSPDTTTSSDGESNAIVVTKAAVVNSALHCSLCNISVTSMPQMQMHLEGAKHAKKLKQCGVEVPAKTTEATAVTVSDAPAGVSADVSILASLNEKSDALSDLSMYRTPTGSYYCKTCNMSMQHVTALQQHLSGKKHLKKSVEEKAATTAITTTKVSILKK